jgi:hypothetical protein
MKFDRQAIEESGKWPCGHDYRESNNIYVKSKGKEFSYCRYCYLKAKREREVRKKYKDELEEGAIILNLNETFNHRYANLALLNDPSPAYTIPFFNGVELTEEETARVKEILKEKLCNMNP